MLDNCSFRIYGFNHLIPFVLIALILSGCGAGARHRWPQSADFSPIRHHIDAVPFLPQKVNQCGPAALAMALQWNGMNVSPEMLSDKVFTPSRKGSLQSAMIAAARRYGQIAYLLDGPEDLLVEIAADQPVVVLQNLGLSWYQVWHYAVVIGFDLAEKKNAASFRYDIGQKRIVSCIRQDLGSEPVLGAAGAAANAHAS